MSKSKEQLIDKNRPKDYYILSTCTTSAPEGRDWEYWDPEANEAYKNMKVAAKDGTLRQDYPYLDPRLCVRAENFHMLEHITPEVQQHSTDINGTIWIPVSRPDLAKKFYKELHAIDNDVQFHPFGADASEIVKKEEGPLQNPIRQKLQGRL